jgi:hypothetical protein
MEAVHSPGQVKKYVPLDQLFDLTFRI